MSGRYQVPAAVQPLVDSRGLITNPWWAWALSIGKNAGDPIEWSNIVNTPTSLGGYGITDAYTKTQVDSMFSGLAAVYQPLSSNLTAYAGGALPSTFTLSIVDAADAAAWRTAIGAGTSSFDGAFSSLSGIPTTISGYGITDAYTETEVDTLLLDYATITSLAPVAFSGDYDDLTNIPAILGEFTGLANAAGVLTNDGSGNLSWGSGGSTYTAGDGLTLASDEFSVDEAFNFTWSGFHTFAGSMQVNGAYGFRIRNASAPANSRNWTWSDPTGSTGALALILVNDAYDNGREAFRATASGFSLATLEYGNSTDLPNHHFYGDFTGNNNTFTGLPAYTGTTPGISLGKDGPFPSMWTYYASAASDEKRWAWYHGLGYGGRMGLYAWSDDANSYNPAIFFDRSGTSLASTLLGAPYLYMASSLEVIRASDSYLRLNQAGNFANGVYTPYDMRVDGNLGIGGSADAKLRVYGPQGSGAYIGYDPAFGDNYFDARVNYFRSTEASYRNTLSLSKSSNVYGNATDLPSHTFYGDMYIYRYLANLAGNLIFRFNDTLLTYGTAVLTGTKGGYCGLALFDGYYYPTFMSDGSIFGVYTQAGSVWSWYDDGTYFRVNSKLIGVTSDRPYTQIVSGGSNAGGRIYISTSGPSGTPSDGDFWVQRAA